MGYMTVGMILNDSFSSVEKHKEVVADGFLKAARMREKSVDIPIGNYANPFTVFSSQHADIPQLFLAFQNSFNRFGYSNDIDNLEYRKRMLKIAQNVLKEEEKAIKELEKKKETL